MSAGFAEGHAPGVHVIVDGRNVMRSRWPNVAERDLVAAIAAWAHAEDHQVAVVFDGRYDGAGPTTVDHDDRTLVVATGREVADDVIAREAAALGDADVELWVVTSDRGLRARVEAHAARLIGGGRYLGELGLR